MSHLEAWKIVATQLGFILGALSIPVGWIWLGARSLSGPAREPGPLDAVLVLSGVIWTLYFVLKGWPL